MRCRLSKCDHVFLYIEVSVLEKHPVGSKVLERNVCVSNSEIKAEKEQPDHEVFKMCSDVQMKLRIECFKCSIRPH